MASNFEIQRLLEEDTSSTLYLVQDKKRGRESCLRRFKTRKPEEIEGLKELFMQISHIDSPHLQPVEEFGTDKDGFFVVTGEPPQGETLTEELRRGPLTQAEFEAVALQLLQVLGALHEQAVVHGSLRPDFVRIQGGEAAGWRITLHGFGQGFAARDDSKEEQIRAYRCTAPEQWHDGTTRRRTDVYALGCVLYEALAARPPFDAKVLKELRHKHISHDLAPLQKLASHVPSWMCAWVMHLLAVDPEQRPRKAAAARDLFERREAPKLPELPPRSETPLEIAPVTPMVSLNPQPPSSPVVLPVVTHTAAMHVTSSTIPIATGPHVAARQPNRSAKVVPAPRKPSAPPRKSPGQSSLKKHMKPALIAAATVVLILLVFILPRCGKLPAPAKGKPSAPAKGKPPASKKR
ncbi:MAG: protein kinase [Verrucomicrobiaceae bacterium]|nr:protein kinase [Verrucomicrobiaceae bacterium]